MPVKNVSSFKWFKNIDDNIILYSRFIVLKKEGNVTLWIGVTSVAFYNQLILQYDAKS